MGSSPPALNNLLDTWGILYHQIGFNSRTLMMDEVTLRITRVEFKIFLFGVPFTRHEKPAVSANLLGKASPSFKSVVEWEA